MLTKEYIVNAVAEIDELTVEQSDDNGLLVWDDQDAKIIPFRFLEEMDTDALAHLIYVSEDIPDRFVIDKAILAEYLWNVCDKNAFVTLDEMVIIWSEAEESATFEPADFVDDGAKHLYEKFGDEYAFEIGQGNLGQLWFERNVVVVNMGEIVRTSEEAGVDDRVCPLLSAKPSLEIQIKKQESVSKGFASEKPSGRRAKGADAPAVNNGYGRVNGANAREQF